MTLNLSLLYVLWLEENCQISPNKNKPPNLWHVTSILVWCIFVNRHIINVHKGQTPYQCTLCESSFTKEFGLNMHMKIVHKEEKAIDKIRKCPICEEEFPNSHDLNRHILSVHEGQTPYKCTMCESSFAQSFELTHHKKTVHKETKQKIPCPICEVEFSSSSHLNRHILSVHKVKYSKGQ